MKKTLLSVIAAAAMCLSAAAEATPATGYTLTVSVEGVRSDAGKIMAQLLKADGTTGKAIEAGGQFAAAKPGTLTLSFAGLEAGDYGVRLFHDEDGDGDLKTNLIGMPKEGFGFSNRALAKFGPPSFDEMKVSVAADTTTGAVLVY